MKVENYQYNRWDYWIEGLNTFPKVISLITARIIHIDIWGENKVIWTSENQWAKET